jgi:hypothetical protein
LGLFTILVEPMVEDNQTHKNWTHWVRNLEISISRLIGVSFKPQHNFTQVDK